MKPGWTIDLGVMRYANAIALQKRIVAARKLGVVPDVLLLVEHPHVITLGRNAKREHLLASSSLLRQMNVEVSETDRGGDITYHGPGQLVAYPILNLGEIKRDLVWYVRQLEEAMVRTSADFGVKAERRAGRTGIWVGTASGDEEKLGAIGVHVSRWVTSHGLAYNVSTDLRHFDLIVPCGIRNKRATSLEKLCGRAVRIGEIAPRMVQHIGECFGIALEPASPKKLEETLVAGEAANLGPANSGANLAPPDVTSAAAN
jgi:lipoyl(octanoyl) transferase